MSRVAMLSFANHDAKYIKRAAISPKVDDCCTDDILQYAGRRVISYLCSARLRESFVEARFESGLQFGLAQARQQETLACRQARPVE